MRRAAACLVAASLLGLLAAQERRPAFVIAQDAQGRPLAGAAVTCFASPTLLEAGDDVDVVEGVTDERGRFVCRLLTHRVYSAFAIVDGAAGAFLASDVCENVAAGGEIVLRVAIARRPQRVVLEGQAAWQHVGPLRIMMAPSARNLLLIEGKDGHVPRLPDLGCVLVRDAQGQPLWSQGYLAHQAWRPAGDELPQLRDPVVVELPPPRDLRVRVVAPGGAPMPRAELWQWIEPCDPQSYGYCPGALPRAALRLAGRCGEDGMATVQCRRSANSWRCRPRSCARRAPSAAPTGSAASPMAGASTATGRIASRSPPGSN